MHVVMFFLTHKQPFAFNLDIYKAAAMAKHVLSLVFHFYITFLKLETEGGTQGMDTLSQTFLFWRVLLRISELYKKDTE